MHGIIPENIMDIRRIAMHSYPVILACNMDGKQTTFRAGNQYYRGAIQDKALFNMERPWHPIRND